MDRQEFVESMAALGYSKPLGEVFVASSIDSLSGAQYNIVERTPGEFVIYEPDGRGGYLPAMVAVGSPFVGRSIESAYEHIYNSVSEAHRIYGVRSEAGGGFRSTRKARDANQNPANVLLAKVLRTVSLGVIILVILVMAAAIGSSVWSLTNSLFNFSW